MGNANSQHHVVLHFADPAHGLDFQANIPAASNVDSLKAAARTAFPKLESGKEHRFFTSDDHSPIRSDADLHKKYMEALELAKLDGRLTVPSPTAEQPEQQQKVSSSMKSPLSAPPQQQQQPQFIFHLHCEEIDLKEERAQQTKNSEKSFDELQASYYDADSTLPQQGDGGTETMQQKNQLGAEAIDDSMPLTEVLSKSFSSAGKQLASSSSSSTMMLAKAAGSAVAESSSSPLKKAAAQPTADSLAPTAKRLADVVFIGAGPCGLWAAVQLKIRAPHLRIVCFEKYAVFQRSHVLLLESNSMWWRPSHKGLSELVESFFGGKLNAAVRTNDLEAKLLAFAKAIGVVVIIRKIDDVAALVRELNYPCAVVGSDGSHSMVRAEFMTHGKQKKPAAGEESEKKKKEKSDLSADDVIDRTVVIKYEVAVKPPKAGEEQPALTLSGPQAYALQKLLPFGYGTFQHVKSTKKKDGGEGGSNSSDSSSKSKKPVAAESAPAAALPTAAAAASAAAAAATVTPTDPVSATTAAVTIFNGVPESHFTTTLHSNFKNPIRLPQAAAILEQRGDKAEAARILESWSLVHPDLRCAIAGFLEARKQIVGEEADLLSVKISPVPLRCYRATYFSEMVEIPPAPSDAQPAGAAAAAASPPSSGSPAKGFFSTISDGFASIATSPSKVKELFSPTSPALTLKTACFLVGDSSFGIPYFRACNAGLLAGSRLANLLTAALTPDLIEYNNVETRKALASSLNSACNDYHMYSVLLAGSEFVRAKAKGQLLSVLRGTVQLSAANPLQIITLDGDVEARIVRAMMVEATRDREAPPTGLVGRLHFADVKRVAATSKSRSSEPVKNPVEKEESEKQPKKKKAE